MKTPTFENIYKKEINNEIRNILNRTDSKKMYDMLRYHFGWLEEDLKKETEVYGGKQYRSVLCLSIAEIISGNYKKALPAAVSVELFHNFTLIHDDIEDSDEFRRGKKTLWHIWGIPHGINTGDAQLMLSIKALEKLRETGLNPERIFEIQNHMNETFLGIIDGQHMDIGFTEVGISDVSVDEYLEMVTKKTSILVAAAAKAGAMCVTQDKAKIEEAYNFGLNFGLAYQICDDLIGIWGNKELTGKDELSDIREKKKTLAVIYAFDKANQEIKDELNRIYSSEKIDQKNAERVVEILESLKAYDYVWNLVEERREKAINSLKKLGVSDKIDYWEKMIFNLTPNVKNKETF